MHKLEEAVPIKASTLLSLIYFLPTSFEPDSLSFTLMTHYMDYQLVLIFSSSL